MRLRRSAVPIDVEPEPDVVDITERLAPYGHAELRPGWRADLVAADAKRQARALHSDPWGFRG